MPCLRLASQYQITLCDTPARSASSLCDSPAAAR